MNTDKLKCPKCGAAYPAMRLIRNIGWMMRCPSCSTRLAFTPQSSQRMGAIAGLTFGAIIVLAGGGNILKWPTFAWFMLFAFVYGCILALFLGALDVVPDKMSFDPFPNQRGVWKTLSIGSMVTVSILGLSGFFWKQFSLSGIFVMSGLMLLAGIILLVTTVHNLFGKSGILRKENKSEPKPDGDGLRPSP